MIVVKESMDLREFDAWSGAADTMSDLEKAYANGKFDWDYLEVEILEIIGDDAGSVYNTTLNDFLWFETDTIANILGYEDWEDFVKRAVNLEEDEEEEEDEDEE